MNKEKRVREIRAITTREPFGSKELMWHDQLRKMDIYEIPLEYLIYNKRNGRILSGTKSYEAQGKDVDPETEQGRKNIEKLLWDSKRDRNKRTMEDMEKYGQKRIGIITNDGIIIDGNRRVMILQKLNKSHFKAVILPVALEDEPLEIEKLETSYQMGEDEKLQYNPIEKYLKAQSLEKMDVSVSDMATWMGEKEATVKDYLKVMKTMDEYLEYWEYHYMYTQLYGREDHFINLTKWLNTFYGGGSMKAFDGYSNNDVDDLKSIAFDHIRAKYEGKQFRLLGHGLRPGHLFGDREIWESFKNGHFEKIIPILDTERPIDLTSQNLAATLESRDDEYGQKVYKDLEENMKEHEQKIYNREHKDKPEKLLNKALDEVRTARSNPNVRNSGVVDKIRELHGVTEEILKEDAPLKLCERVLEILSSLSLSSHAKSKDTLMELLSEISKVTYQLQKQAKRL